MFQFLPFLWIQKYHLHSLFFQLSYENYVKGFQSFLGLGEWERPHIFSGPHVWILKACEMKHSLHFGLEETSQFYDLFSSKPTSLPLPIFSMAEKKSYSSKNQSYSQKRYNFFLCHLCSHLFRNMHICNTPRDIRHFTTPSFLRNMHQLWQQPKTYLAHSHALACFLPC